MDTPVEDGWEFKFNHAPIDKRCGRTPSYPVSPYS
jgi:hypothetical protein